jgi:hypothetical protein
MMMMVITDNYPFHLFGIFFFLKYSYIGPFAICLGGRKGKCCSTVFEMKNEAEMWGSFTLGHIAH